MKREIMQSMDAAMSWVPVAALILFMVIFFAVVVWSYRNGSNEIFAEVSSSALDDGEQMNNIGEK